jgi:hypothetical protein
MKERKASERFWKSGKPSGKPNHETADFADYANFLDLADTFILGLAAEAWRPKAKSVKSA